MKKLFLLATIGLSLAAGAQGQTLGYVTKPLPLFSNEFAASVTGSTTLNIANTNVLTTTGPANNTTFVAIPRNTPSIAVTMSYTSTNGLATSTTNTEVAGFNVTQDGTNWTTTFPYYHTNTAPAGVNGTAATVNDTFYISGPSNGPIQFQGIRLDSFQVLGTNAMQINPASSVGFIQ